MILLKNMNYFWKPKQFSKKAKHLWKFEQILKLLNIIEFFEFLNKYKEKKTITRKNKNKKEEEKHCETLEEKN